MRILTSHAVLTTGYISCKINNLTTKLDIIQKSAHQDETQLVISDLDPRLEYCVRIAATTVAWTRNIVAYESVQQYIWCN